jgi:hypothetical protein
MFTFNKTTGTYNVEFENINVPQTRKLKKKQTQLFPDDQDPIFFVPFPTGTIVVFDNNTGKYTRKDKGKQIIESEEEEEPEFEPEVLD